MAKPTEQDNEAQAIEWFIFGHDRDAVGWTVKSSLRAALQDARGLTRRDEHGVPSDPLTRSWPGALLYLVMLEQVGKCVEPKGSTTPTDVKEPVQRALFHFGPPLSVPERAAVYALRNSFAHDFGLTSNPTDAKLGKPHPRRHRFQLSPEPGELVQLPYVAWNGYYGARASGGATVVSLRELGDMVERIVASLEVSARAGELSLVPGRSPQEVVERFTLMYREPTP